MRAPIVRALVERSAEITSIPMTANRVGRRWMSTLVVELPGGAAESLPEKKSAVKQASAGATPLRVFATFARNFLRPNPTSTGRRGSAVATATVVCNREANRNQLLHPAEHESAGSAESDRDPGRYPLSCRLSTEHGLDEEGYGIAVLLHRRRYGIARTVTRRCVSVKPQRGWGLDVDPASKTRVHINYLAAHPVGPVRCSDAVTFAPSPFA
jgi:hypothetical protein